MQNSINRYMLEKMATIYQDCLSAYDNYRFYDILKIVMPFISNELSAFYLDYSKDILYIESKLSFERVALQSVLFDITYTLLLLLNPIIPHTTSEAYFEFPYKDEEELYLCRYHQPRDASNSVLLEKMATFFNIRTNVLKKLEEARAAKIIGKSNEASVIISVTQEELDTLNELKINLTQALIVSQVELKLSDTPSVEVIKASGIVCERCWNTVSSVNEGGLCERCQAILDKEVKL
jgi:isoleucyl-tRNA synthetase